MDDFQRTMLAAKVETAIKRQPRMKELRERLLGIGGEETVFHYFEEDLKSILDRGHEIDGIYARKTWQREGQCHRNTAELYDLWEQGEFEKRCKQMGIMTGYALSEDGLWRQHSWLINGFNRVLETTSPRLKYYGYAMNKEEIERFICDNF